MARPSWPDPRWLKPAAHAACAAPLAWLAWDTWSQQLGPDPIAQLTHRTGIVAIRLLLCTLAVTPLRRLTRQAWLVRFRRMLGLWTFAYASLHLAVYVVLDLGGYWPQLFEDLRKRPFIVAGFTAWALMLPLAATSTAWAMRRLGRRWQQLHRLVYVAGIAAVLHFWWLVKTGKVIARIEPVVYAAILLVLLLARLVPARRRAPPPG
jgi:sulfoxide reductase heme-binding subunit YedZ